MPLLSFPLPPLSPPLTPNQPPTNHSHPHPNRAQGAAIGLESASVLSYLLSSATHPSQIPELLYLNNSLRQPRVRRIIEASKRAGEMWMLPDGPLQVERDRVFLEKKGEGYPNMLEDPEFQEWLWGVDARGGSG